MSCLLQYKETKHWKVRNEHGSWQPQLETVCKHITVTPWSLKDDSRMSLPVIDAHSADDLHLPLAGVAVNLLCNCNISERILQSCASLPVCAACWLNVTFVPLSSECYYSTRVVSCTDEISLALCCVRRCMLLWTSCVRLAGSPLQYKQQLEVLSLCACPFAFT